MRLRPKVRGLVVLYLTILVAFFMLLVGCGWWAFFGPDLMVFSNTLTPEKQYRLMTGLEKTPDVRDIEGIGGGWQGHDFWLRFRCDHTTVDRLVALGFEPADPSDVRQRLDFDAHARSFSPDHFTPDCEPGDVETQRCFKMKHVRNDWTESGETYFAHDPSTGWVHLYQTGT